MSTFGYIRTFLTSLYSVPFPMSNCQLPGELSSSKFMRLNFPENQKIWFHDDVLEHVRPLAEKWSKQKLSSDASIFGIRYLTGAWLSLFVAPKKEKTIGVILQVRALSYSLTKASLLGGAEAFGKQTLPNFSARTDLKKNPLGNLKSFAF